MQIGSICFDNKKADRGLKEVRSESMRAPTTNMQLLH